MKKILMIGGGVSGKAVASLANVLNIPCNVVSDAETVNANLDELFNGVDMVVVSPGVLPTSRLYQAALARSLEVISELELGRRYFAGKCVAVTGTNGKTTTVELTEFILKHLGLQVAADIIKNNINASDMISVLEVSSFQLEHTYELKAEAAVLLNVESDHINRYPGGMAEYRSVKERIFRQVPQDKCFYGCSMTGNAVSGIFEIAGDTLFAGGTELVDLNKTAFAAAHNRENLLAALSLVQSLLPLNDRLNELSDILQKFKTGDHRISLVAEKNGVKYIDDSKATNPAAVIAAVKSLAPEPAENIVLIAGGLDKDMDFSALKAIEKYLRKVIVYGRCGSNIAAVFAGSIDVFNAGTDFALAVKTAAETAEKGNIVLLSPAAASMDMFKDYKERGDVFARLANNL